MSNRFQKNTVAVVDEKEVKVQTPAPENVSDVVDTLITQAPPVQPHVIEHFEKQAESVADEFSNFVDRFGVKFDPALHVVGRDGKPSLSKNQKLYRKPGAPFPGKTISEKKKIVTPGTQSSKSFVGTDGPASEQPAQSELKPEHKATGIALAGAIMALAVAIGGEEFNPIKRDDLGLDERTMLENAAAEWLRAKNMVDLPPDYAFAIVIGSFIIPRFTMPKTQNRLKLFFQWLGGKWVSWRSKKSLINANIKNR